MVFQACGVIGKTHIHINKQYLAKNSAKNSMPAHFFFFKIISNQGTILDLNKAG